QLCELAETTGAPVASTLLGLSAMPADHPQFVGMVGMHGHYGANRLTNAADVIVGIGLRFDDRVTGAVERYAPQAQIVQIDIDPAELGRHVPVAIGLSGDAGAVLAQWLPLLQTRCHDA